MTEFKKRNMRQNSKNNTDLKKVQIPCDLKTRVNQSSVTTLIFVEAAETMLVLTEVTGCLVALGLSGTAIITEPVLLQIRAPGLHSTWAATAVTCCDSSCLKDNTFLHINQMALWPQSIARHRWNWKAWFGSLIISAQVSVEYSHWCHWNASESWKRWQQVWKYMVIMSDILRVAQISLSALISLALHTIWILGKCKHWVMRDRTESSFAF